MTTRDQHGNYRVTCDTCGRHHTAQPTEYAARQSAGRGGFTLKGSEFGDRDLCVLCAFDERATFRMWG